MIEDKKIAVGSLNPVKIDAVRLKCETVWPGCQVVGIDIASGVSDMPMSDEECIIGARNRAIGARDQTDSAYGFGLEGGVESTPAGLMMVGWAVVIDQAGKSWIGGAPRLMLPEWIAARIHNGEELGQVMDDLTQAENTKQKGGAAGILSGHLTNRREAFAIAVAYALSLFVVPDYHRVR